jgi:CDP-diglyceride synthetase
LLTPKLSLKQDMLGSLQTASGAYLVIFIASHINSVFILARYFGTDTDYAWATGAPTGLIADAWNVRLIPHYSLGVLLVLCHIACGLRTVMLAHGVNLQRANRVCWILIAACSVWAAVIVAGMLGVRV